VRPRVAARLESQGPATLGTLIREGLVSTHQLGHYALCNPWFKRLGDGRIDLTSAGREALRSLRRMLGAVNA
jgi:hypothetical protein